MTEFATILILILMFVSAFVSTAGITDDFFPDTTDSRRPSSNYVRNWQYELIDKNEALSEKMVESCINSGNSDKALKFLDDSKINGMETPVWMKKLVIRAKHGKAVEIARAGNRTEAIARLKQLIDETGDRQNIYYDYIVILSWDRQYERALKAFDEISSREDIPKYVLSSVYDSYVQTGNLNGISAISKRLGMPVPEDIKKAIVAKQEKEAVDKSLSEMHDKAIRAARNGKYDESFILLDNLLDAGYSKSSILSDKIIILVWAEKYSEAIKLYEEYRKNNTPDYNLLNTIGSAYRRTGKYPEAIKCCDESLALNKDNPDAVKGKVFALLASGRSPEAYEFIRQEMKKHHKAPSWLNLLTGEAYVVEGRNDDAETFFSEYLKTDPDNIFAKRILAGILVQKRKRLDEAERLVDEILAVEPANIDVMFLKVTLFQLKKNYFAAYELNEKILSLNKIYQPAINARYHILMDMKAVVLANEILKETGDKVSFQVKRRLSGDLAAAQLSWLEPAKAMETLDNNIKIEEEYDKSRKDTAPLVDDATIKRESFDEILAYYQSKDMKNVIKSFEEMSAKGVKPPYWIKMVAASAYIYCRNPENALVLYREAHDEIKTLGKDVYPDNYDVLMGIYSVLVELEKQRAAYEVLDQLDKEIPSFARPNGTYIANNQKLNVLIEKGWWHVYNDQLSDADDYLSEMAEKAPGNTYIRTALAYVHYYRGWPRQALEDFQIATVLDPNDKSAKVGLAYTLNENDEWEEARTLAAELAKQYPTDLDVKRLQRSFELQEMRTLTIDSNYSNEGSFVDGSGITMRLEQPIFPDRKIYAETLWLMTKAPKTSTQEGARRNIYRGAVGFDWRLERDLKFFGEASMDYHAENPGFMAGLAYNPFDQLTLTGFYNSYTLNMPPKALLFGHKGQEANVSAEYRMSEDFIATIGFSNVWVSGGNVNQTYSWRLDKGIYYSADWKFRIALEGSTTTNTKVDTDYYSPKYYTSIYLVPMLEHLWYRRYETSIVDRMFVGVGPHWEKDFNCRSQYYLRYEQEYQLTDYFGFKVGGKVGKERYGEDSPFAWGLYASLTWKF
jgi:biofilm PGA synthesis protein PgaA